MGLYGTGLLQLWRTLVPHVVLSRTVQVLAVTVPQSTFANDHLAPTVKQQRRFLAVPKTNGTKSQMSLAEVLLPFRLRCLTYEERTSVLFAFHEKYTAT